MSVAKKNAPMADGLHQLTFGELRRKVVEAAVAPDPATPALKLFCVVLALMGLGLVVQAGHAAGTVEGFGEYVSSVKEHMIFRGAGILALVAAFWIGPAGIRRFIPFLLVSSALLLVMVYVEPFSARLNGSRRWVTLLPGLTFQPSELARIVLVLWIADRCVRLGEGLRDFRTGLLPILAVIVTLFLLVAGETDLGGSLLLLFCSIATLWVGGGKMTHLALSVVAFGGGAITVGAAMIPYIRGRVDMFFGATQNEQVASSIDAISLGGFDGLGLSHGVVRQGGIPYLNSDYVFSQIGEELGLMGTGLVLILLLAFLWFSLRLVLSIRCRYQALAAFGLLLSVSLQAMIHVQVNSGLAPPKGMTLPFISDGGTSLLVSSIAVGLALGASRHAASTSQPFEES
ncbi:MAG: FtsW/RodA/SpoVE family cell cycle protein [Planctomycetota bacterium]|nr:FtsW/RodA/SpoVE family cell cycle protein [Planctomycetota bacterium]